MSHAHKDAFSTLKGAGLKATPVRIAILGLFSGECKPMNADDAFARLKGGGANLVTVYRTLASFEKAGILNKVDLHQGSAYYELSGHHHHHIVCVDCGTIEGFDGCDMDSLAEKTLAESERFSTIRRHSLEFFGVCKSCAKR